MTEALVPVEIFCSYANVDEVWRKKLETHLSLLKRQGLVSFWHDRLLAPGTDWAKAIDTHLETASIILLLVSADFFASDYCYGVEMQRALAREADGSARVVPILVRKADWTDAPFSHLQALPTDATPIASWVDTDTALTDVAAGIRRIIVEDLPLLTTSAPRAALPAIWNIPYPRNSFFLGRESELLRIRQNLQTGQATALSQPQAISGLGGIGKTQLALEYAYRYHQDYTAVLWAHAESTNALISSYVTLATLLRLPEHEAKEQEVTVQAVKIWLQIHRDWLLILDNADDLTLLPDFLPPALAGHLLLTTRAAATGRLAHRLEIETLPHEQGALLLLRRAALLEPFATLGQASQEERELAVQISQDLGGLPLALDQAGAYLEETGTDLTSYRQIYQQHRANLLRQRRGLVADHPAPVATTWSLAFQRVEEKNPSAADLLRMLAFLSPDAIPEEILTAGAPMLGPVLAPVVADAFLLNQAIEALRAYSLVRRDPSGKILSIHRLVQAVLQDAMEETQRLTWAERAMRAINVALPGAFPYMNHETWSQYERLLPQALTATQLIEQYQIICWEAGHLLAEIAYYFHCRGRYAEAEPLFQRALHLWEQTRGPEHLDVASLLNILAGNYREQGKYAEVESLYQRALRIREQQLGPEHPDVAGPLNDLGNLYLEQGKYAEAEPLYQRALYLREQSQQEPEYPRPAGPLYNLGSLYQKQGKYVEAESFYQRALRIWEQGWGPEHPNVAYALNGLADLYQEQGKYAEVESLYQRALRIREQALGPEHPDVAEPLNGLANLYRRQGKYAEAESLYQRSLYLREQSQGLEHPQVAGPLNGLANLYSDQGKYGEAESLYQRALHIREQHLGSEHPETAETIHDFARFREKQGNSQKARVWYARALAAREQALGVHHPQTMKTRTRLIALLHVMGLHEQVAQLEAVQSEQ